VTGCRVRASLAHHYILLASLERQINGPREPSRARHDYRVSNIDKSWRLTSSRSSHAAVQSRRTPGCSTRSANSSPRPGVEDSRVPAGTLLVQRQGGRCEACAATHDQDRDALPADVYVNCDACDGPGTTARRSRSGTGESRSATYSPCRSPRADVLRPPASILRHIQSLVDVGLGYVRLGQPAPTLSAARHSASSWLPSWPGVRRATPSTCSTSRRPDCTSRTSIACCRCCTAGDQGNTVLVIEHNLDVIKTATGSSTSGRGGAAAGWSWRGHPEQVAKLKTAPAPSCGRCCPATGADPSAGQAVRVPRQSGATCFARAGFGHLRGQGLSLAQRLANYFQAPRR